MTNLTKQEIEDWKLKFNKVLTRMYNLEIVPEIQSRINERIPDSGGFRVFENEELESWLSSKKESWIREEREKIIKVVNSFYLIASQGGFKHLSDGLKYGKFRDLILNELQKNTQREEER